MRKVRVAKQSAGRKACSASESSRAPMKVSSRTGTRVNLSSMTQIARPGRKSCKVRMVIRRCSRDNTTRSQLSRYGNNVAKASHKGHHYREDLCENAANDGYSEWEETELIV